MPHHLQRRLGELSGLGLLLLLPLLGRSRWDAEALRDEVRRYVVEALGAVDRGSGSR